MHENAYLAFDLGATSGRAILGSFDGARLRLEEIHRFVTPIVEEGERLYWDVERLEREVRTGLHLARKRAPGLKSLSVDSWGVDYVPLNRDGRPVRPPYCYRDPRVRGFMQRAFEAVPAEEIYRATGIQFMEINTLYQFLADRVLDPEGYEQTHLNLLIGDYLHYRLCGNPVAERSLASTTQMMAVNSRSWAGALLEKLGLDAARWPTIVRSGTVVGSLDGVAVVAGCSHDTGCAVAAVPALMDESWAYLSCGTWSLLGVERAAPLITDAAREAGFTNEAGIGNTIRLLKNLTGLWVLSECERAWKADGAVYTYDELMTEARASASCGSVVDLADGRFALRGGMQDKLHAWCDEHGIGRPTSRGALARLVLESMAEAHRCALDELEEVMGHRIDVLYMVGGGSRNDLLCELTARACQRRVVAGPCEATAMGNLLIQAMAMDDLDAPHQIREVVRASTSLREYTFED